MAEISRRFLLGSFLAAPAVLTLGAHMPVSRAKPVWVSFDIKGLTAGDIIAGYNCVVNYDVVLDRWAIYQCP